MDEAFLSGLRDLLQEQCRLPPLPSGWRCASAMLAAEGFTYGGDFFVADLAPGAEDASVLTMVLVDVCGSGETALPEAVEFAGALRGLIVALPGDQLLAAANQVLLRSPCDESIATAAQVVIDLDSGYYTICSAGHPPVLRWDAAEREWIVDNARGTALGVVERPELDVSTGVLASGDALLFYTDGVVESRARDIDDGIDWLREVAAVAVRDDRMAELPARVLAQVRRGDDDRALLVLARE